MMKIKVRKDKEITNTNHLELIKEILKLNLKEEMRNKPLTERLRTITREIVKIEVNMITEITEINVITETTIEEITEVITTEDTIIMTEMIEMTDNITEEEEEEMMMIMTMIEKIAENTETTSVEIEVTDKIERELTNLSMMIIKKIISKKKKKLIKHHN